MRSVADKLRERDREELRKLPYKERLDLIFELGEADLALFCRAKGLDRETAIRLLQRRRQAGRTPSKCMSALIG